MHAEQAGGGASKAPKSVSRKPSSVTTGIQPSDVFAIRALAADIPAIWNAPTTTDIDRKQIIRTVIDKITVAVVGDSELVDVTITWADGHDTAGQASRPVARLDQLSYYPRILALVTELTAAGQSSAQIARALNDQGLRPPKRTDRFGSGQILTLARRLGLRVRHPRGTRTALTNLSPGHWSVAEIAVMLEMPTATVYNWIYRGWITARHRPEGTRNYWIIEADEAELQRLRERRARPPGYYTRARWTEPGQDTARSDPEGQT